MVQISGRKKYLAFVALSFSFIVCASDAEKKTADSNTATMMARWACYAGSAACLVDLFFDVVPWDVHKDCLNAIKLIELAMVCGLFVCGEVVFDDGLKKAQKEQIEKKIGPRSKIKLNGGVSEPVATQQKSEVLSKMQKEKPSTERFQKSQPLKKQRFRDKIRILLARLRSKK